MGPRRREPRSAGALTTRAGRRSSSPARRRRPGPAAGSPRWRERGRPARGGRGLAAGGPRRQGGGDPAAGGLRRQEGGQPHVGIPTLFNFLRVLTVRNLIMFCLPCYLPALNKTPHRIYDMSAWSIQEDRGRKGYMDLLGIYSSVSQKHVGDTSKESTALDKRLHSAHKLYNTAA